jgi:hypothetical protein
MRLIRGAYGGLAWANQVEPAKAPADADVEGIDAVADSTGGMEVVDVLKIDIEGKPS